MFVSVDGNDRRFGAGLCCLPMLLFLVGCGGVEPKEGLVEAYGYVTLDGEPLVNAEVTFDHPDQAGTYGRTDSGGYYEISFTRAQEGAFAGPNMVSFSTAEPERGIKEGVPKQYQAGKSVLQVDVVDGGAPYNFDLTSEPAAE